MNNKCINEVKHVKFLGVNIDSTLNWSSHIDNLRSQLHQNLGLIYYASMYLPRHILILLYNSLINSRIVYCIEVWGNAPAIYLNRILMIQKRLIRIIFKKKTTDHTAELFKKARILPVNLLYIYKICLLAHTTFASSDPTASHYRTRYSEISLPFPKSTSAAGHRQVNYQIAAAWNNLPQHVRQITSLGGFKLALKLHLLDSLV